MTGLVPSRQAPPTRPPSPAPATGTTTRRDQHRCVFGSHAEFADLYEKFLDAVYESLAEDEAWNGRWRLSRQVGNEIRLRRARTVLDCAAGTGFPGLDLAAEASDHGIETLHLTDGDPEMIRVLRRKAANFRLRLPSEGQVRWSSSGAGAVRIVDPLLLQWAELGQIKRAYDYVLCRGNSLAYADTWTGDTDPASRATIINYLSQIAAKVRIGGYLHIDAPWTAELDEQKYRPVASGAVPIWEKVETGADHRHWRVDFKFPNGLTLKFERYSSRLTIHDLADALNEMGFEDTEPFTMAGERPNYGVIIARRSTNG